MYIYKCVHHIIIFMESGYLKSPISTDFQAHHGFSYSIISFWLIFLVEENSGKVCVFLDHFMSKSIFILQSLQNDTF